MVNNKQILALAASLFVQQALALNAHRHGHRGFHAKKDVVVVQETNVVVVTDTVVVTVYQDGSPVEAATTEATTEATTKATTPTTKATTPTTLVAVTKSSSSSTSTPKAATTSTTPVVKAAAKVETTSTSTTPTPTPSTTSTKATPTTSTTSTKTTPTTTSSAAATTTAASSSGDKRGLAYNSGSLLSPFLNSGSKISWSYNWGQTADSAAPSDLEFVPMMWGPTHADGWAANAEAAIASGSTSFLSFNEPDNAGQANLDASTAASLHQEYLNPYADKVRISTPAITNSQSSGEGIEWLSSFISACDGKCSYDFCAAHWYNYPVSSEFLSHLLDIYDVCGKNVWITEFAPISGTDDEINTFLTEVMDQMDNNATFAFVERYSYFMAATGSLLTSTTSLSTYGNSYAYN